jgi:hypothetical protein
VSPADPVEAKEADVADPGEVQEAKAREREIQQGKYGAEKIKPHKADEAKTSWIEITLKDEDGKPVPGEAYSITLPDGESIAAGTLDDKGFARVDGFESGTCKVTFPELDKEGWKAG